MFYFSRLEKAMENITLQCTNREFQDWLSDKFWIFGLQWKAKIVSSQTIQVPIEFRQFYSSQLDKVFAKCYTDKNGNLTYAPVKYTVALDQ